jgi:hypothetical protein
MDFLSQLGHLIIIGEQFEWCQTKTTFITFGLIILHRELNTIKVKKLVKQESQFIVPKCTRMQQNEFSFSKKILG